MKNLDANAKPTDAVDELVHQFTDPFAFYRELIQNSIDAGSTRVEVALSFRPASGKGLCFASVTDWGEGMNRRIIEDYLVTKFRSAKEHDLTKIGKYGIGFVSIFAAAPDAVVVDTGRDGESWRVLFKQDRSFELLALPRPVEGTRVTLHKELSAAEYDEFAARSLAAVKKWCRYSEVEVAFAAGPADGGQAAAPVLVREEVQVDAPFQVEHREEGTHIVAGPSRSATPKTCFFNRGLTLLEADEALVPGVAVNVVSRYLEHTLTRDNVRRDRHFDKVRKLAQRLVATELRQKLPEQSRRLALDPNGADDWRVLFSYACAHADPRKLFYRLAGGGAASADEVLKAVKKERALVVSPAATPLCRRLGEAGVPVLEALPHGPLALQLSAVFKPPTVRVADRAYVGAEPPPSQPTAFARALTELLGRAGAGIEGVLVAELDGHGAEPDGKGHELRWALVEQPRRPLACERALASPFSSRCPPLLCLNLRHPQVAAAARLFSTGPRLAALLLARCVLVAHGRLTARASAELLEGALR